MKTINYIGISKTKSSRFSKFSYLLEMTKGDRIVTGKALRYGYLEKSWKHGSPRGWYISDVSMAIDDFHKYYEMAEGTVKVKEFLDFTR